MALIYRPAHGNDPGTPMPMPMAIETSHGLLVAILRAGHPKVFAINPLAASRYRDRHGVSHKKSDPRDALVGEHPPHRHAHAPASAGCCTARSAIAVPKPVQGEETITALVAHVLHALGVPGY